jgi:hypothetical protein
MSEVAKNDYYYSRFDVPNINTLNKIYDENYSVENFKLEEENSDALPDDYTSLEAIRNAIADPLIEKLKKYESFINRSFSTNKDNKVEISVNEIISGFKGN